MKDTKPNLQKVQKTPGIKIKTNKLKQLRHVIFKLLKTKSRETLKGTQRQKKNFTYKGTKKEITTDFSSETIQARRQWSVIVILNTLKKKM